MSYMGEADANGWRVEGEEEGAKKNRKGHTKDSSSVDYNMTGFCIYIKLCLYD